jgi:dephospho-CoA kinase
VGLTGGIASGKSLVSGMLRHRGLTIIDADEIGREITTADEALREDLIRILGTQVVQSPGGFNRAMAAKMIFADPQKRRALEELLHPAIVAEMRKRTATCGGIVVWDVPLLVETGLHHDVNTVVLVYVTREIQMFRLINRDDISREEALTRLASQLPLEEKLVHADYLINNNFSIEETESQVVRLHHALGSN